MLTVISTCLWEFIQEVAPAQAAVQRALAHRRQTRAQQVRHQQNRPKPLLPNGKLLINNISSHHCGLTSIDRDCWRSSPLAYENLSKKLLQPRTILRHEHTGAHESSLRQGIEPTQTFASKWKVTHKQHLIEPLRIDLHWRNVDARLHLLMRVYPRSCSSPGPIH